MPDTPSIVIVKTITYRGKAEQYSNKYHFSGTTPADPAAWKTLADAIITAEKPCYHPSTTFTGALGYEAGNNNSVAQIDYTAAPNVVVAGTLAPQQANQFQGGDAAVWIRWKTSDRTSRGKWIYLRKYMHGAWTETINDAIMVGQKTALTTFGNKLTDGTLPGGFKVCGPQGAVAGAMTVSPYVTTRTLKRRGKRP